MFIKKILLFSVLLLVLLSAIFFGLLKLKQYRLSKLGGGDRYFSLIHDSIERKYLVHAPPSYDKARQIPLVIMFHGGGGTGVWAMKETGWDKKADEEGFLAVFPDGTRPHPSKPAKFAGRNAQSWNDGSGRAISAAERNVDDIGFIRAMIDDLKTNYNIDPKRIYATGFSNGGSMTFRVGRELSEIVAAIAPSAGADWTNLPPARAIPILYLTGTEDPLNPLEGGKIGIREFGFGVKKPVRETIARWVDMLYCPSEPGVSYDKNGVKGISYSPCKNGAEVVFYTVEGMGHVWAGHKNLLPEKIVGKSSDKIDANDVIWEFFRNHPMK